MPKIYQLQPDIFGKYVPKLSQKLPEAISFISGAIITDSLPTPLIFATRHSEKEQPQGLHGMVVPVMSNSFINALRDAGIANLQCFPAEIRSTVDETIWKNYQAVNIIGKIACADLTASQSTHIMDRPGNDTTPLVAFEDLKVDPSRVGDALLFRLAESPGVILIAESVVKHLRSIHSDNEWGITLDER